jgi:UDP-xylose/UDP-N-acetylglucosamine transporter B4
MDRSGSIYAPRSLFHGQALHAQTNCTSPSPFSVPYQRGIATHADGHSSLLLLSLYSFWRPFRAKIAVAIVSSGVIIATLFRPRTESPITIIRDSGTATNYTGTTDATTATGTVDTSRYTIGIAMLLASLVCTGVHGALQERTYSTYGPYWRESIFYTVRPHYYFSNI